MHTQTRAKISRPRTWIHLLQKYQQGLLVSHLIDRLCGRCIHILKIICLFQNSSGIPDLPEVHLKGTKLFNIMFCIIITVSRDIHKRK